ncbi:hypothetical protein F3K40_27970 [Streptomyces sp. LBUM 1478]|uniref:hypothetical protein n=1 Tax=Streptomyces scabiei TaxID=1930 RepID=UPI00076610E7|nr:MULTISPECIES: hypothetical protein [Streptomyces]MBP5870922.1 hypothetical protein [Streptomyces sp. LBUM 1485]MBP5908754.1 hypothetical protein [Streptomyces sp. LBUM 1478]MBP5927687.1 hypothetical protein [Streptomyces sp. LBUM 1479]MBP5913174.1 hypothetical protein [Streptomyces sp. LBUM 1486]MDX2532355.1 hypothetical protein [Streptomyces scabiei]
MRELPLPLALTARLLPVAVLATAGWALSSGPLAASPAGENATQDTASAPISTSESAPSTTAVTKTYAKAPSPCSGVTTKTVKSLVPGAKTAGKEIASTNESVRRTCSWNALKGFDYRWLDVSYEIQQSDDKARSAYATRTTEKSGGGAVPGLGDEAYSVVNLTTDDKQQTREGVVYVRMSNALVVVTYNGSDFESQKAPGTDVINKGAIKAAKEAAAVLKGAR